MATSPPVIDADPIDRPVDIPIGIPTGTFVPPRTVLDDVADAVVDYLANYVVVQFVEFEFTTGDVLNTNEVAHFRLHVINRGPLTMKDVKIRINGRNGAKVKGPGAADVFDGEAFANVIDTVGGHNADNPFETERLHLTAPAGTKPVGTDLVEAFIDDWNALWDHTLNSHSRALDTRVGLFESQVHAQ